MLVNVQLPPGATQERTRAVMEQVESFMLKQPEVQSMVGVLGFSFSGQGQNAALAFVTLKDWDQRAEPENSAQALAGRAFGALMGIRDAFIFPLSPPPIPELGTASGFTFRLQDRAGQGHEALVAARNQLLGMAAQSKVLSQVRPDGLEDAPQLQIEVDRDKAAALGVGFDSDQRDAVDRAGLVLRQRLPEQRPAAARDRAGRRAGAHAARGPAAPERQQRPGPAGAAVGLRQHALGRRCDADRALQRLPGDAHRRRRGAGLQHRRRDGRDGAPGGAAAAGIRLRVDRHQPRGEDRRQRRR